MSEQREVKGFNHDCQMATTENVSPGSVYKIWFISFMRLHRHICIYMHLKGARSNNGTLGLY